LDLILLNPGLRNKTRWSSEFEMVIRYGKLRAT
jgi:hypothetical protein